MKKSHFKFIFFFVIFFLCYFPLKISGEESRVVFNFPDATEIKELAKVIALWKNKNIILDPKVSGKVQIVSPKAISKEEAYAAFLVSIDVLGYTILETGKIIKIVPLRDSVKAGSKIFSGKIPILQTEELVTHIIPLTHLNVDDAVRLLSNMVDAGSLFAVKDSNTLIVSSQGSKIQKVLKLVSYLDTESHHKDIFVLPVFYRYAKDMEKFIKDMLPKSVGKGNSLKAPAGEGDLFVDERLNALIVVGSANFKTYINDTVKKFDLPESKTKKENFYVFPLENLEAAKISRDINSVMSSYRGGDQKKSDKQALTILPDEGTNSLLIAGTQEEFDTVRKVVRKLDTKQGQVFCEIKILLLNSNSYFSFGTSSFLPAGGKGEQDTKYLVGWEANSSIPITLSSALKSDGQTSSDQAKKLMLDPLSQEMVVGILPFGKVKVSGLGEISPAALVKLVQTDGYTTIVTNGHLLAQNNTEASMSIGETYIYEQNDDAGGKFVSKMNKENVDLTINIKPSISLSEHASLDIKVEDSIIAGYEANGVPRIVKRKASHIVQVKTGQLIAISGFERKSDTFTENKFPILGDIPIIGRLFKTTKNKSDIFKLVIFVEPHILYGEEDFTALYEKRFKNLKKETIR